MKTIKMVNDLKHLAPWFDVMKYADSESFGIDDWISSIRIRKNVLSFLKKMKLLAAFEMDLPEDLEEIKQLRRELEHLRNNPLDINACQSWASVEGDFDKCAGINPVRDLLFSDLISQYQYDQKILEEDDRPADKAVRWAQISAERDNFAAANAFWDEITDEQRRRELHAERWKMLTIPSHMPTPGELQNMPLGMLGGNATPLIIDTRATNSVIIEAFKRWLIGYRKKTAIDKAKRNKPDYKRWAEYGILPYLDLQIWALENQIEIIDEVMAEAVTPNRSIENFYTTTKKHANDLLRDLTELRAMSPSSGKDSSIT
ncbi:DUF6387 family protein [Stutzerimonas nitrititolerans]|uniref:DUF6387 family protein n=1 Tax=Stutzerimonas nitrititolerans TaxID=2482751 RepID=UPI0028A2170E|nr:DUF6387 family protein [Stutzerimonas nitrititolerans]